MKNSSNTVRNLALIVVTLVALRFVFGLGIIEQTVHKIFSPTTEIIEDFAFEDSNQNSDQSSEIKISQLEQENQRLKAAIEQNEQEVLASVIRKDIVNFRRFLFIDKGSSSDLKKLDAVTFNGNLIGKIARLNNSTATVILINDPEFKTTAKTNDGDGGVIKTQNGSLVFDLVPSNSLSGSTISTDGLNGEFRPGIPIGLLGDRISSEDAAFHTYHVLLPDPYTLIDFVGIDKGVN